MAALAALALAAAGCGASDGLPRERLSGKVTLDGAPLESGTIQFMPNASGGGAALGGGAMIEGGAYEIPRDAGLVPGTYRVNIFSPEEVADFKEGGSDVKADEGELPGESPATPRGQARREPPRRARERVPARYNTESTLTAEVTKGGDNAFNFDLRSK